MPREILSKKHFARLGGAAPVGTKTDDYKERLLKYIPAEIVTLYMALKGLIEATNASWKVPAAWAIIAVGVIATVLYLFKTMETPNWKQIIISTLAFVVWVLAVSGEPFTSLYSANHAAEANFKLVTGLILPLYTFGVALYEP
jgi:hypothetical protein